MITKSTFLWDGGCRRLITACATGVLVPFLSLNSVQAVAVDSEILLLVDVSKGLSDDDFTLMTQGIADSFRSATVLNAIQSGHEGSVAVSLVFWSGLKDQQTVVPWVNISNSVTADTFALSVQNATRPWNNKKTALGDAISETSTYFGTETGGTANGFESSVQVVNVIGGSEDDNTPPGSNYSGAVQAARNLALASGADIINGIAVTQDDADIVAYYDSFVVGGSVGSVQGSTVAAADYSSLSTSFTPILASTLTQAAATTVPEPVTGLLLISSCGLLFHRRR